MNYLIIDDEPIAHRIIEGYCAKLGHLQKVGNAYQAFEASSIMMQQPVDLIFLDINMPKMTGFEWLKTLHQSPNIIVTTAYKEYALEGYELNIVDYLLKPFSFDRFLAALNKVIPLHTIRSQGSISTDDSSNKRFFLKGDKKYHQINMDDILFVEAFGNYCKVHLTTETIVTHEKISTLETSLSPNDFLRVHKSFIVATAKIKLIQGNLIHIHDHQIPVGQTYRRSISQLLRR